MSEVKKVTDMIELEGARIIFRNFSGRGSQYNREGDRNVGIVLDDRELAERLIDDGWNVRVLAARDEGEEPTYWLPTSMKFDPYPPHIYMVMGRKKILLDENSVGELDNADIECVDVLIRPYNWEIPSGKSGVKAYIKTMYVVCRQDHFASKYDFSSDMPLPDEPPF